MHLLHSIRDRTTAGGLLYGRSTHSSMDACHNPDLPKRFLVHKNGLAVTCLDWFEWLYAALGQYECCKVDMLKTAAATVLHALSETVVLQGRLDWQSDIAGARLQKATYIALSNDIAVAPC